MDLRQVLEAVVGSAPCTVEVVVAGAGAAGEVRVGSPAAGQAEFWNAQRTSLRSMLPL